jgi:hypothetical protein
MRTLWETNKPLTAVAILMLPFLLISIMGLIVDPRLIAGAPAWLKPAKFAISIAAYALTIAWFFRYLPEWRRGRSITGWLTALTMVVEIVIISAQAARGVSSHFNNGTPMGAILFSIMGVAILIAWFASIAIAVALFRHPFHDPVMGWAIRLGMLITVVGSATGGLMVTPTKSQLAQARVSHHMPVSGAHTVGAPDGGPGLPVTGWSRQHGDLRAPHFFGLHAMQILPLLAWLLKPKRPAFMVGLAAAYFGLYLALLVQALAGIPLLQGGA